MKASACPNGQGCCEDKMEENCACHSEFSEGRMAYDCDHNDKNITVCITLQL